MMRLKCECMAGALVSRLRFIVRSTLMALLPAILLSIPISSQADDNEGVTDYAKALPFRATKSNVNTDRCVEFFDKYDSFARVKALGDPYTVKPNDIVEVKLMQAFIKNFPTSQWLKSDPTGSIAIVANVTELSAKGSQNPQDFNFSQSATTAGRLVFYSSDVRKEQLLNLSQLPIYGPVTYNGRPLALTIHIFSLNINDQQVNSMLKSLAAIGALAYPPASPVLALLETLGTSLVTSRQAATSVMTYRFMLVPSGPQRDGVDAGLLEYGNYVLRRLEDRTNFVHWGNLIYDNSNGLIYSKAVNDQDHSNVVCRATGAFKDDTFLSMQINKASEEVALDTSVDLDKLIAQLKEVDKTKASAIDAVTTQIKETISGEQSTKTALGQLDQYFKNNDRSATLKAQLSSLVDSVANSLKPAAPPATTPAAATPTVPFTSTQVTKIVQRMSEYAGTYAGRVTTASFDATCVKQYLTLVAITDACK